MQNKLYNNLHTKEAQKYIGRVGGGGVAGEVGRVGGQRGSYRECGRKMEGGEESVRWRWMEGGREG